MLLIESERTDFPEIINTRVLHLFLFFKKVLADHLVLLKMSLRGP